MLLSDLSTRKRHDTLWLALGFVLQDLPGSSNTQYVAEKLRARLGFPASELRIVLSWLTKTAAPLIPEASQTGEVVKAYGRYGRRWIWSPRGPARAQLPIGKIEAMLTESGALDCSDW